jgi:putative ABC transport system permease protein
MKKEYLDIEELLIDEFFLAWYFDVTDNNKEKWQDWKDWMDVDLGRVRMLVEAVRTMDGLTLAEKPIPYRQVERSANRLLLRIGALDEQRRLQPESKHRPAYRFFLFRNYMTIAVRNLIKDKGFSFINIFGLALGLAACLLITLYVKDELSYDRFNAKADRTYRIHSDLRINGNGGGEELYTPAPMGPVLVKDYPQIEAAVRLTWLHDILIKKGNTTVSEKDAVYADSTIFDVFTLPLIAGNPHTALTHANDMVISESMARKYFGTTDVLGKTLHINNTKDYTITGVMKDMRGNSHFHANFINAMTELDFSRASNWLNNGMATYFVVRPGTTAEEAGRIVNEITGKYIVPEALAFVHSTNPADVQNAQTHLRYFPVPLLSIHLHSHTGSELGNNGNSRYIYIFTIIAGFILLIACVNFMNLSTARSARRAKEVGVRKVLGSMRSELIGQFLTESLLTSALAMFIALILTALLLPYFNLLADKHFTYAVLLQGSLLPWLVAATIIVGLLAGIYPAFFLSAFQPVRVLKGQLAAGFRSGWLRNGLVTFQFTIAIILIVGTLVIYRQLNYIRHKDLGYHREQVVVISNTYSLWIHALGFKKDVEKLPGVLGTTMTYFLPSYAGAGTNVFFKDRSLTSANSVALSDWPVDADYIPTLGMQIAKGRNFSALQPTDSSGVIINETAASELGFSNPIGQHLYEKRDSGQVATYNILGVVKDFHPGSLHNRIPPMMLHLAEERGALAVRLRTADVHGLMARIEKAFRSWDKMSDQPFPYYFMDETFNKLYQEDERTGTLFVSFAAFAIFIGCLGLFGLVTYAAEQRTKEIGIRKILGATAGSIVGMLSKEFMGLILLSAVIAFPIAWWAMNKWLQDFAYQTTISWWIFAAAGGSAVGITLLTIGFRALRAARANPVKSLRTE